MTKSGAEAAERVQQELVVLDLVAYILESIGIDLEAVQVLCNCETPPAA